MSVTLLKRMFLQRPHAISSFKNAKWMVLATVLLHVDFSCLKDSIRQVYNSFCFQILKMLFVAYSSGRHY